MLLQLEDLVIKGARRIEGGVTGHEAAIAERDQDVAFGDDFAIEIRHPLIRPGRHARLLLGDCGAIIGADSERGKPIRRWPDRTGSAPIARGPAWLRRCWRRSAPAPRACRGSRRAASTRPQ